MGQTSEDGLQHLTKGEKAAEMKLMRFYKSEQCSLTRDLPVYSYTVVNLWFELKAKNPS